MTSAPASDPWALFRNKPYRWLYPVSCLLPYALPFMSQIGMNKDFIGLAMLITVLLGAGVVAFANLAFGVLLLRRLRGRERIFIAACFVAGGIVPGVLFAMMIFESGPV